MRVTMLGTLGSGKTTFMAGLHKTLFESNVRGFHIVPKANSNLSIPNDFDSLARQEMIAGSFEHLSFEYLKGYPEKTNKTTLWQMDLNHSVEKVVGFEWIDYRGGILMDSTDENIFADEARVNDIKNLYSHLQSSQAIMLFVDAFKLTKAPSISRARSITNINTMTRFLMRFAEQNTKSELTFLIVLTKIDAIEQEWHNKDYANLLDLTNEAFEQFRQVCLSSTSWSGGIVPISSVGEGNAKNQIKDNNSENYFEREISLASTISNEPEPYNVSHALFFCIGDLLRRQNLQDRKTNFETQKILGEAVRKMQNEDPLSVFFKKLAQQPTAANEVAKLWTKNQEEIQQLNRYDSILRQLYEEAIRKVTIIK